MPRDKGLKQNSGATRVCNRGGGGPRQHGVLTHGHLVGGLEKIHSDLQQQKNFIQSVVEAKNVNRNELHQLRTNLRHYLEERKQE